MIYSSKTPRDLNHDPEPWAIPYARTHGRYNTSGYVGGTYLVYDPRPEFDHAQQNEPNPLLADMREFWPVVIEDWLAALDDPWFMDGIPAELGIATEDHREHARKVLTRLVDMSKV